MSTFDWVLRAVVVLPLLYLTFLTVRDWLAASRRGEAVSLLSESAGRPRPFWVQVVTTIVGFAVAIPYFYYLWIPVWRPSPRLDQALNIVGVLVYVVGIGFAFVARSALGRNWGVSTGAQVKLVPGHELIRGGPYAVVRHPMYFGSWLAVLGLILIYPVWALVILLPSMVVSFTRRALREEGALSARFGEAWAEYSRQTSFIIPFVW